MAKTIMENENKNTTDATELSPRPAQQGGIGFIPEREKIVAFLLATAKRSDDWADAINSEIATAYESKLKEIRRAESSILKSAAYAIERGVHLKEEERAGFLIPRVKEVGRK